MKLTKGQAEYLARLQAKPKEAASGKFLFWEPVGSYGEARTALSLARKGLVEVSGLTGAWIDLKVRATPGYYRRLTQDTESV